MNSITLKEARCRTGLDLLSDNHIYCNDAGYGRLTVRESQRRKELLTPEHRQIRLAAMKYFGDSHFDIYPKGIAINNIYACLDFAVFRRKKVFFVEVLTASWATCKDVQHKAKIQNYAPLWLVIEKKSKKQFNHPYEYYNFLRRVHRLSRRFNVLLCDLSSKIKQINRHGA